MDLTFEIRKFFRDPFNRYLVVGLLFLAIAVTLLIPSQEIETDGPSVHFFILSGCPHCAEQEPILRELEQEFPNVNFYYHDASTPEGARLYIQLCEKHGLGTDSIRTPTTFVGESYFIGVYPKEIIKAELEECITNCSLGLPTTRKGEPIKSAEINVTSFDLPLLGKTDLTSFGLPVLAITMGFIDGLNPCAIWVLVYMITMIMNVNDKKKIWIIVGSFIFASGVLYFLFMAAWLNAFLIIGYVRFVQVGIGSFALGAGILNLRSYFKTRGALVCKVEDSESRKKTMEKIQKIASSPLSWGIFFSIVVLAFAVNLVEFVCSSFLPAAFVYVLSLKALPPLYHYLYIALYVFFFMLDDLILFGLAAFAVTRFSGEKYVKFCKLFGGVIMLFLGLFLLFAPHLLR